MGIFNHFDICCESNTFGHKQCKSFLETTEHNCITGCQEKKHSGSALLNLLLTNNEEWVGDVKRLMVMLAVVRMR